ncbi:HesA/MoeB/ThiF family protein [Frankia sp. Mgl5]|uniref:HesA/MoeB/ThiF family protein n=1 Tax=Frankia sp. Mgl5 TaxID=2933793 RepID=UPI00200E17C8|nr:HesA/MoeB/ThiF family protein [Frankia sp. Mgl5]MCK9929172.1 HesA/MoeB/ThiF family protein [Frankia sp. Mgl5]
MERSMIVTRRSSPPASGPVGPVDARGASEAAVPATALAPTALALALAPAPVPVPAPAPAQRSGGASLPGRYDRQLDLPGFGPAAQERLRGATVLVAGVGGVGGAAATYLAAAGVGRLVLVHPGALEEPDLNRQTLMRPEWIGGSRVACAEQTLRAHHPGVEIVAIDRELSQLPELGRLVAGVDVVVDARHNFPDRYLLNDACVATRTPAVVAAMNATEGNLLVVQPGSPCLRCVFTEGDPSWQPLGFTVLGAVSGMVGCLAATEAIKIISGFGEPAAGKLLQFDLWDLDFRVLRARRDPHCPSCGGQRPGSGEPR